MFKSILTLLITAMLMPSLSAFAGDPEAYVVLNNGTLTFKYDDQRPESGAYGMNTASSHPMWVDKNSQVSKVVFDASFAGYEPISCKEWFSGCQNLTTIEGIANLKTNKVTSMFEMFRDCNKLTSIDLSRFNTANVGNMEGMFRSCSSLTILDLAQFNTATVSNMKSMFQGCSKLETILISGAWSDKNVEHSEDMFDGCLATSLTQDTREAYVVFSNGTLTFKYDNNKPDGAYSLNTPSANAPWNTRLSSTTTVVFDDSFRNYKPKTCIHWFNGGSNITQIIGMSENLNTEAVTQTANMFKGCSQLTSIDLSRFNTENVDRMDFMFQSCSSLAVLNLTTFNTAKVNTMQSMFDGCSNLKTIFVSDNWITIKVDHSESMFRDCNNLKGYKGTTYNSANVDKAYAQIDKGTTDPGYLSIKLISIAITTQPITTQVEKGKALDLTGIAVLAKYADGTESSVNIDDIVIEGFDNATLGAQTVTLNYGGFTTTLQVTVVDPSTPVAATISNTNTKVWSNNHTIFIETQPDTKYTVVDINGRLITTSTTKSTREEIQVNYNGIAVVIINGSSFKVYVQ